MSRQLYIYSAILWRIAHTTALCAAARMTAISTAAQTAWTEKLYRSGWLDGPALNFFLEELNPAWSLLQPAVKVRQIIEETHDTRSFVLKPGWGFGQFQPGQHVGVSVEINGRQHERRYSISSSPGARARGLITITVKREPNGKVSNHLHDNIKVGDRIRLTRPQGEFVLPQPIPEKLLLIAAGSGITPLMSQLRSLLANGYAGDIVLLNYVRSQDDRIFGDALDELSAQYPQLRVDWCLERENQERFSAEQLQQRVPDYAQRFAMLCGPAGFMQAVRQHWHAHNLDAQLRFEYFGSPQPLQTPDKAAGVAAHIVLNRSGRSIDASAGQAALLALEAAGEKPAYGCRMGICQSCRCRKISGPVRNLLTGAVSHEPNEEIQLCISAAEDDVVLDY